MKVYDSGVPSPSFGMSLDEYNAEVDHYVDEVRVTVLPLCSPHPLNGEVVRVPYADGYAEYMVARLEGSVGLVHLAILDAWRDDRFERTATVKELTELVKARKAREALFSSHTS